MPSPAFHPSIAVASNGLDVSGFNTSIVVIVLIVSLLLYAAVNSIEIAIIAADRIRIRHLAEQGSRRAQALERLRSERDLFFTAIVLLQNLFVVVSATMAGVISVEVLGNLGLVFGTLITTVLLAVIGEVTPKVLAARVTEQYALIVALPAEWLMTALRPFIVTMAALPRALSRLFFGAAGATTPTVTEAELRMLIDIGTVEKALTEETGELLESVFSFRDRQVQEIMVPRTDVVWLEADATVADFYLVFDQKSHSRFPVYKESIDNVVGVVGIKDVLRGLARDEVDPSTPIEKCLRPTYFIPETKPVAALFWEMQEAGHQMAIVVDEYGGTAGIVTAEMLLEEMVGPLADELARAPKEFEAIDEKTVQIDGGMSVSEANEELGLNIPEGRYETIAGYVLDALGHIPREGETVAGESFTLVVTRMSGTKIERVLVRRA